eukprot:1160292-Pelagomonas_calceolata.AAC.4
MGPALRDEQGQKAQVPPSVAKWGDPAALLARYLLISGCLPLIRDKPLLPLYALPRVRELSQPTGS